MSGLLLQKMEWLKQPNPFVEKVRQLQLKTLCVREIKFHCHSSLKMFSSGLGNISLENLSEDDIRIRESLMRQTSLSRNTQSKASTTRGSSLEFTIN